MVVFSFAAFQKTLAFSRQRTHYERPMTDLQAASHRLVNMAINNEISRSLMPADVHRDMVAETYGIKPGWKTGRP